MTTVATAPHECEGNLIFTKYGLSPYWAATKALLGGFNWDGDESVDVEINGEPSTVRFNYSKGGIAPRRQDSVDGDRLYEVRISWHGQGQRKVHFLIQPRFRDMRHFETGERIDTPFDHIGVDEGVNVRFQGSNLEPHEYAELLPDLIQLLGQEAGTPINASYLATEPHEMSNITTYERYVRINREWSQKVVGRTGIVHRLSQLYAEEKGSQYTLHVDNEDVVGKNTRLLLSPEDARRLVSGHRFGKQIKHYHPKNVRTNEEGDPLYHPKVGVLLKKSLNDSAFRWSDRDELRREIDETLINLLYWSDVPVQPDSTTYVTDDHFNVSAASRPVSLESDPTPKMEANQEALLVTTLRDLCESDVEVLESLVRGGGNRHPDELADSTGRGISTIYRALGRLGELVQNDNASVSFASKKIEQEIDAIVESTEHQIENAADRAAKLLNIETRAAASSAWREFCDKYTAKLIETDVDGDDTTLRIETMLSELRSGPHPQLNEVLNEALDAWHSVGRDVLDLRRARLKWRDPTGDWKYGKVSANLR